MFKALLKTQLSSLLFSVSTSRKKRPLSLAGVVLLFCFIGICLLLTFFSVSMGAGLVLLPAGLTAVYFGLLTSIGFLISIFGSFLAAKAQLFDAKDNELLQAMPIPPSLILLSRIVVLYITAELYLLATILPALVAYFLLMPAAVTPLLVIGCLLSTLFLGLLAVTVSCFFGFLAALIASFFRNKTVVTIAMTLVFFVLYFYGYSQLLRIEEMDDIAMEALVATLQASPLAYIGLPFSGSFLPLLLFIMGCSAVFVLLILFMSRNYNRLTTRHTGEKRRSYRADSSRLSGGVRTALFTKDIKLVFSNATYVLNGAFGLFLYLFLAVFLIIKGNDLYLNLQTQLSELIAAGGLPGMTTAESFLRSMLLPVGVAAFSLIGGFNLITAPSISVEGKTMWLLQSMPLHPFSILMSKIYTQMAVTLPPLLLADLSCVFVFRLTFAEGVLLFLCPAVFSLFSAAFGICMNLLLPKFNAVNISVIVKQSASVFFTMFGVMILVGILTVAGIFLIPFLSGVLYVVLITVLFAGVDTLLLLYLFTGGSRKFVKLSAKIG